MCIYKIAWSAYEFLDVYLDFSLFYLLFGGFYAFWIFDVFILLFYFKNLYGLCKNHMHYSMMNLLRIM